MLRVFGRFELYDHAGEALRERVVNIASNAEAFLLNELLFLEVRAGGAAPQRG